VFFQARGIGDIFDLQVGALSFNVSDSVTPDITFEFLLSYISWSAIRSIFNMDPSIIARLGSEFQYVDGDRASKCKHFPPSSRSHGS
jgi:hypothetical protein